jgi:3-isopropylmalate/(R)-2-methylmalate dehydratase large subunit
LTHDIPIHIFDAAKEIRVGQTIAEKIFSKKAGRTVVPGEIIEIAPDIAMSHDNTADISNTFYKIGVDKVARPDIHVIVLDHCSPAASQKYAENTSSMSTEESATRCSSRRDS